MLLSHIVRLYILISECKVEDMKDRFYHVCMMVITALLMLSFVMIVSRLMAKEILVDRLDVRNEFVSMLADYYWGDQLSLHPDDNLYPGSSDQYMVLRELYDKDYDDKSDDMEDTDVTDMPENNQPFYGSSALVTKYVDVANEFESDMNHYCNYHFIFRPYLTDFRLACYDAAGWNMAFARNDNEEFMMKNGVIYQAMNLHDNEEIDIIVRNAADENGVPYLFIQHPYRLSREDGYVPYGVDNYYNDNIDNKLSSMREMGIDVMDLRSELYNSGWDNHEGFYLTDNHWKTDTGFLAAKLISEYLASHYDGFVCNEYTHDPENYSIVAVDLNNPMIRENVNIYLPDFDTSFQMIRITDDKTKDTEKIGAFRDTVFESRRMEEGRFSNVLTVYSASNVGSELTEITNNTNTKHYGTVMYISNSFSWHIIPYLAMDCDRVYYVPFTDREKSSEYVAVLRPDLIIEASY